MGTQFKGTPTEVAALDAFIKLMRASEALNSRLNPGLAEAGLSVSQFGALEALYHLGSLCQAELGKKLLKSSGNITMVVDNLEKRGLVRRVRDTADRRFVSVQLTPAGEELIAEVFPRHMQAIVEELRVLDAEDQAALGRLCKKLGRKGA